MARPRPLQSSNGFAAIATSPTESAWTAPAPVRGRAGTPEAEVEGRDVACAALQEEALGARKRTLDGSAQRAREVRVPGHRLAADRDRMAREGDDEGERATGRRVDPQHR